MEKEEVIGLLYSLRAGLSVAYQEEEDIESQLNAIRQRRKGLESNAENCKNRLDRELQDCRQKVATLEKELRSIDISKTVRNAIGRFFYSFFILLLLLVAVCGLIFTIWSAVAGFSGKSYESLSGFEKYIFGWLLEGHGPDWVNNSDWFPIVYLIFGFGVPIALLIVSIIKIKRGAFFGFLGFSKIGKAKKKKSLEEELNNESARLNELKRAANESTQYYQLTTVQSEEEYTEVKKELIDRADILTVYVEALDAVFEPIITRRDWENIDLVIYGLETRRADDIKEALAFVDRERHTERIIDTIREAGRNISYTIETNFNRMNYTIKSCFQLLSNQISAQTRLFASQLNQLGEQNVALSARMAQFTSEARLMGASLEKANVASEKIASHVQKISTLADSLRY